MVSFPFHFPQLTAPSSLTSHLTHPRQTRTFSLLLFVDHNHQTSHSLIQGLSSSKASPPLHPPLTFPNSTSPPPSPTIPAILELSSVGFCACLWAPAFEGLAPLVACSVILNRVLKGLGSAESPQAAHPRGTAHPPVTRATAGNHSAVFSPCKPLGPAWQSCVGCEWFKVEIRQTTNIAKAGCSAITGSCQERITLNLLSITPFHRATLITFFEVRCSH